MNNLFMAFIFAATGLLAYLQEADVALDPAIATAPTTGTNTLSPTIALTNSTTFSHTIEGLVWHDIDEDGILGDSEQGIDDVGVELLDSTGEVVDSTTTDIEGRYAFTAVAPSSEQQGTLNCSGR